MEWKIRDDCFCADGRKGVYVYGDWGRGRACVHVPGQPMKIMPWDEARAYCETYDNEGVPTLCNHLEEGWLIFR